MHFSEIISSIMEKMRQAGGVEVAFGNPHTVNDLTIIPVAKVAYGFGMGGGKSVNVKVNKYYKTDKPDEVEKTVTEATPEPEIPDDEETKPHDKPKGDFGGGGGGGMKTQPLGVFVIHNDSVKFMPVVTIKEIVIGAVIVMMTFWHLKHSKHRKR